MSSQISYPWRLQLISVSPLISDPPEFSSPCVCVCMCVCVCVCVGGGGHFFCRLQMASLLLCRLSKREQNHIGKLLGSVGRSGFSLPVSAPHCLRWGWLYFPAALTMKEFSIFLGLLLAPADNVSVMPAFMMALPGPSSVSQVTLSIAVCLLC